MKTAVALEEYLSAVNIPQHESDVDFLADFYAHAIAWVCNQIDERDQLIEDLTRRLVNLENRGKRLGPE